MSASEGEIFKDTEEVVTQINPLETDEVDERPWFNDT